jgi:enamine deaminase RidA (YjgF/YER057c/UK114 family)
MTPPRTPQAGSHVSAFPHARVRRAGDLIFVGGLVDLDTDPGSRAFYDPPVKAQTRAIYAALEDALRQEGVGLDAIVSLLQYFLGREPAAGYIEQRRAYFTGPQPASTGIGVTDMVSTGAVVQVEGIVAVPRPGLAVEHVATAKSPQNVRAGYSQAATFGDWIFCAGAMASDYASAAAYPGAVGTGVAAAARADPNYWNAVPVKSELRYILHDKLAPVLEAAGSSLSGIVAAHVHLLYPSDDYAAFREAWLSAFEGRPPVTVVSPTSGLGTWGGRLEVTPIALKSAARVPPMEISVPGARRPFGDEPLACRVGDLVFTATQVAADDRGVLASVVPDRRLSHFVDQSELEMQAILDQVALICEAAGGTLRDVVRAHLYLTDMRKLAAAMRPWRERLGADVAASFVSVRDGGIVPGCTLSFDAVAHIPRSGGR